MIIMIIIIIIIIIIVYYYHLSILCAFEINSMAAYVTSVLLTLYVLEMREES